MNFNLYLLLTYIITICIILGSPGPTTLLVINASIRGNLIAGLLTAIGAIVASLLLMMLSFIIIKGIFAINKQELACLTLIGSIYLLYLAYSISYSSFTQSVVKKVHSKTQYFFTGFLTGILNPKYILFFIAFFPSFMMILPDITHSISILAIIWITLGCTILFTYSVIFSKRISYKITNIINKSSGILLCFIAFVSLYSNSVFLWRSL